MHEYTRNSANSEVNSNFAIYFILLHTLRIEVYV